MKYLKPDEVSKPVVKTILNFFNSAETAEEIAEVIEIPERRDIGMKIAKNILEIRNEKGNFTDLKQIDEIPYIGPKRFTYIINSLKNDMQSKEKIKMKAENEEIPLMMFESDASAPLLRYDIPSPSSYEGQNYVGLDIPERFFNSKTAFNKPSYLEILSNNKEEIQEYLINSRKEDLEKDFSLFLAVEENIDDFIDISYKGTFDFEKEKIGTQGTSINFVDWCAKSSSTSIVKGDSNHKNVLKHSSPKRNKMYEFANHFPQVESSGIREFWFKTEINDRGGHMLIMFRQRHLGNASIFISLNNNILSCLSGSKWKSISNITPNEWYHFRIQWFDNNKFKIWINEIEKIKEGTFSNKGSIHNFSIDTRGAAIYIDAFGNPADPDYNLGDNLALEDKKEAYLEYIQSINTEYLELLNNIQEQVDVDGNIIDYAIEAKNKFFSYYIQIALNLENKIPIFYRSMGGKLKIRFLRVPKTPRPILIFVETNKLTNFPGDYGAGTTIKTFSLLPKEQTEISIKTWKRTIVSTEQASSILDSYTTEKADEFENGIQAEYSRGDKVEESFGYHAEASAKTSWGGSANVGFAKAHSDTTLSASGGVKGGINSTRETFAKNVINATAKHSQNASAKREINIDTSYEKTEEMEVEIVIMRKIKNLNASRTLNFTFRQMNQQFHSIIHLTDLRIAVYNGYPGSMEEFELFELSDLVNKYFANPKFVFNELKEVILNEYGNIIDYQGVPQKLVEEFSPYNDVELNKMKYLRVIPPRIVNGEIFGKQGYTMREAKEDQEEDVRYLNGVIIANQVLTMRTDGVIVESLLGKANALDNYSLNAREQKIREKRVKSDLIEANIAKIKTGLEIINAFIKNNEYDKARKAYTEIFGVQSGLEAFSEMFSPRDLVLSKE